MGGTRHCRTTDMSRGLAAVIAVGATLLVGLGGLIIGLRSRTGNRLDRIESKVHSQGERIAHVEGLLAGARLRLDAPRT